MSIMETQPQKILRSGWKAYVNDYAISGGWNFNGEALIICEAAGGIYVFAVSYTHLTLPTNREV